MERRSASDGTTVGTALDVRPLCGETRVATLPMTAIMQRVGVQLILRTMKAEFSQKKGLNIAEAMKQYDVVHRSLNQSIRAYTSSFRDAEVRMRDAKL